MKTNFPYQKLKTLFGVKKLAATQWKQFLEGDACSNIHKESVNKMWNGVLYI